MTKGRKLRPRCRCFAPGRTPFEQWINSRRGFDISISRFVVDETAIVKQAIKAHVHGTDAALRPSRSPAVDSEGD